MMLTTVVECTKMKGTSVGSQMLRYLSIYMLVTVKFQKKTKFILNDKIYSEPDFVYFYDY